MTQLSHIQGIEIGEYDYALPEEQIAKYPLPERDSSRLLIYRSSGGLIRESVFNRLGDNLPTGTLLVFNNTRVIQARLMFRKDSGGLIQLLCLEPDSPRDYGQNFLSRGSCSWRCLVGNLRRWRSGRLCQSFAMGSTAVTLSAERCAGGDGQVQRIQFSWDKPEFTFGEILEAVGILPIPPYLHRETEASDKEAYQTVYSKVRGSVAAPTAGLHFTERLLSELRVGGVRTCELTLHVGAGTFKPVSTDVIGGHVMHTELFSVKRSVIAGLLENIGRITAVGTTTVRTLESLYYIGLSSPPDCQVSQWAPYEVVSSGQSEKTVEASLSNIIRFLDSNGLDEIVATTRLLIAPGYRFRLVNNMITNFHQPRSTLLLLVSAFVGGEWRKLYDYALSHNFRFLSYGDSCLLLGSGGISSALY